MDLKNLSILFVVISIAMVQALAFMVPSDESNYNKEQMQSLRMELDHHRQQIDMKFWDNILPALKKVGGACKDKLWKAALKIGKKFLKDGFLKFLGIKGEDGYRQDGFFGDLFGDIAKKAIKLIKEFYNEKMKPAVIKFWKVAKPLLIEAGKDCWAIFQGEAGNFIEVGEHMIAMNEEEDEKI